MTSQPLDRPFKLFCLPGDGVGPEVCTAALEVLDAVARMANIDFQIETGPVGMAAHAACGAFVMPDTLDLARDADAVLFGAEGGPEWDALRVRSGKPGALMLLRQGLDLYANIRPVRRWPLPPEVTPFRTDVVEGADLVIVRELAGGVYTGLPKRTDDVAGDRVAIDTQSYSGAQVDRVARVAFDLARGRSGAVTSIDKANVMETGRLWRDRVAQLGAAENSDVPLRHLYADAFLYEMVRDPKQFDVVLADNLFGDLASDCAAPIAGSMGMLPSASLSATRKTILFEPVHGAAPGIAGQGVANPVATILCVAMILQMCCARPDLSEAVQLAVSDVLGAGIRTRDIGGQATTADLSGAVVARLAERHGQKIDQP